MCCESIEGVFTPFFALCVYRITNETLCGWTSFLCSPWLNLEITFKLLSLSGLKSNLNLTPQQRTISTEHINMPNELSKVKQQFAKNHKKYELKVEL